MLLMSATGRGIDWRAIERKAAYRTR